MEEEKSTQKKLRNYAIVEGYLRDCNLKNDVTKSGKDCIKGEIVISTSRFESHRIRVFAFKNDKDGKTNSKYASLAELMSPNISSIATYLATLGDDQQNDVLDQGTWESAIKVAAKVWISGSIEEYLVISRDEQGKERETTSFSIRGTNGGIKADSVTHPFNPRATADIDGRIISIMPEIKRSKESGESEETGRSKIALLYIDWKGVGHQFQIYASDEQIPQMGETFSEYVNSNYEQGQTAKFTVSIVNLSETKSVEPKKQGWGATSGPIVKTEFVHELRLIGGRTTAGISEGEPGYITGEEATVALTSRRTAGIENGEKRDSKAAAAPAKGFGSVGASAPAGFVPDASIPSFDPDAF